MKRIYKVPSIKVENGFESLKTDSEAGTQQLNLINNNETPWYQEHQD